MLKITLDEAYVFDLLSIYQVKLDKSIDERKKLIENSYNNLSDEIINQIGIKLYNEIIQSVEYENLLKSNKNVFDLVDRCDETPLSKETANANFDRYNKKIILQNKFFKDKLTEIKL